MKLMYKCFLAFVIPYIVLDVLYFVVLCTLLYLCQLVTLPFMVYVNHILKSGEILEIRMTEKCGIRSNMCYFSQIYLFSDRPLGQSPDVTHYSPSLPTAHSTHTDNCTSEASENHCCMPLTLQQWPGFCTYH